MIQKRLVLTNAIFSVAQVLVIGGTLFFLYRFLIGTIGIERVGIWSLVLATTSIANIANLGLSGSVVKFVAKYNAQDDYKSVADTIQTASISIAVAIALILVIAYPFADWVLRLIVPSTNLGEARVLLPYALISLWLNAIGGVYLSGIDGFQLTYIRSILFMISSILYLVLCFTLVPGYQLIGLAYAQVIQAASMILGSWFMLKRYLPLLPIIPFRWNRRLFGEMIGYGVNFQINSISTMLYDPVTKALLSKFGGLSVVGFYEMANRMILQFRALIVNANQVLVPTIAHVYEKNTRYVQNIYRDSYRLLLYLSLPLFAGIIAFAPYISQIWIGHYEGVFVLFSILLTLGWFINLLAVPTFFINLGTGELCWNTIGHITIGVLNGGLGFLFGSLYGGKAVVIAWVSSLILGSLLIPISYHYRHRIPLTELFPKESIMVMLASVVGMCISLILYYQLHDILNFFLLTFASVLIFTAILGFPLWQHPMRERLTVWAISAFFIKRREAAVR